MCHFNFYNRITKRCWFSFLNIQLTFLTLFNNFKNNNLTVFTKFFLLHLNFIKLKHNFQLSFHYISWISPCDSVFKCSLSSRTFLVWSIVGPFLKDCTLLIFQSLQTLFFINSSEKARSSAYWNGKNKKNQKEEKEY